MADQSSPIVALPGLRGMNTSCLAYAALSSNPIWMQGRSASFSVPAWIRIGLWVFWKCGVALMVKDTFLATSSSVCVLV